MKSGAEGNNRLHAFGADNGNPLATPPETMRGLHHFQTLIAGEDRLYVAANGTVYALAFLRGLSARWASESRTCPQGSSATPSRPTSSSSYCASRAYGLTS
jgi:hypothetical protein